MFMEPLTRFACLSIEKTLRFAKPERLLYAGVKGVGKKKTYIDDKKNFHPSWMVHPLLLEYNTWTWFITCIIKTLPWFGKAQGTSGSHIRHINSSTVIPTFDFSSSATDFLRSPVRAWWEVMDTMGRSVPLYPMDNKHHLPNYLGWSYSWFPTKGINLEESRILSQNWFQFVSWQTFSWLMVACNYGMRIFGA